MPKYLFQATYTAEGIKGLEKDKAAGRKAALSKAVESLGGKVEALYWAFGEHDWVLIADLPEPICQPPPWVDVSPPHGLTFEASDQCDSRGRLCRWPSPPEVPEVPLFHQNKFFIKTNRVPPQHELGDYLGRVGRRCTYSQI